MAGPWEKYASQATDSAPPWEKYGAPKTAQPAGLSALPPEAGAPQNAVDASTQPEDSLVNKVKGVGEAGTALATGAVAGPVGQAYGAAKALTSGKYGTQAGVEAGEKAGSELTNKLTYQPKTKTGQEAVGAIGNALDESRLAGLPVEGSVLNQIGKVPRAAAEAEGALKAAPKAIARAAIDKLPGIDPETAQLAKDAHSMGFRLTPDQVIGGKYSKIAGEGLASVPLSGSNNAANKAVWLENLSKQAGIEGGKPSRTAFGKATQRVGSEIGALNGKYDLPVDNATLTHLGQNAHGQLPDVANVVNFYTDLVKSQAKDGKLSGTTFRQINTRLNDQIKSTSNGDLKYALGNLQDDLLDLQQKQMTPEDRAQLNTLRRQYAIQRTIEPLAAKNATGDIEPSALLGAITSTKAGKARVARGAAGDLGKLADIGARFLKEPKSSGTSERRLIQGLPPALASAVGAGAGVAGGASALPAVLGGIGGTVGAANLYNRAGPAITRALIDRPPS